MNGDFYLAVGEKINIIINIKYMQGAILMKSITLIFVLSLNLFITSCGGGEASNMNQIVPENSNIPNTRFNCVSFKTANLGINLSAPNYYTAQITFADLMKHSAGWRRPFNSPYTSTPVQLDADGYPTEIDLDTQFINIIHDDNWGRDVINDNTYVLLYDGEGTFSLNINHTILQQNPGRIVYQINGQGRTILTLNSTNPANYARNMRFVALSDELTYTTQAFRKGFLENWSNFSTARYMDWLATNNSTVVEWSDRTTSSDLTQSFGAGVAYEYIIQLSNYTKTNPWINIPHMASDDYVTQLATLFKNTLDPDLTVYIEYTNEAWNFIFTQAAHMRDMATALGLSQYYDYYSQRSSEVMDIWANIYSGIAKTRYARVLGTQFTNTGATNRIVSFANAFEHHDVLAIGPYFGGTSGRVNNVDVTLTMTSSELTQYLLDIELPKNKAQMIVQKGIADTYGLRLVTYEAGQHLVAAGNHAILGNLQNYQPLTDLFIATNREPLMKDTYLQYIKNWKEISGGELMNLFSAVGVPSKYGSWGLIEYGSQSMNQAPKAMGVYESTCGSL